MVSAAQSTVGTVEVIDIKASRKALIAGSLGNLIEWYEFAIYAYMAPLIAPIFFPSEDPVAGILSTFVVLAMAFFMRPIGAVVFGRLTDRIGRKPVLVTIILLMSGGTAAIGILPGAEQVGALAGVLLVVCRLIQGISGGGEMGGAVSLMIENAPTGKRGLYGSWSFASTTFGFVVGGSVATILTLVLSPEDLASWGWRIPFLLAIPLGLIALYIRLRVDETPHFKRVQAERQGLIPDTDAVTQKRRYSFGYLVVTILVLVVYNAVGNTFQVGMPTYLSTAYGMDFLPAYLLSLVTGVTATICMPLFGALSDRVGRWPVLLGGAIATAVLSYPLYLMMEFGFGGGLVALFIAGALIGVIGGPMPAFLAERFPTRHRATGVSVIYALSVAIFGGFAPYIITWIYSVTGNPLAAAFYTAACAVLSVIGGIAWRLSSSHKVHEQPLED
jgi:MFS family permease